MSDFAKFCPKCYAFFRDPDLYSKHVATCGFAKDKAADSRQPSAKTTDNRRQTAVKKSHEAEKAEHIPATVEEDSAAVCDQPSAVVPEGASPQVKTKFKT